MSRLRYRPEIDGLRALAVLPVVFFHTHLRVPGGYIGVDIFFVISGFLITALINAEIMAGTFSLRNFWERRVRRIVPAASVTVIAALVAGHFLLLPSDFAELGRSAVAQVLMVANFYFHSESGYFSTVAESKPLLHFWSLAVEEQFYLIFPFVLLGLWRFGSGSAIRGVAVLAAVSFGFSVVGAWRFQEATFYLLPTRAWELALGSLLALSGCRLPLPERARTGAGWLGIALMVLPMFLYDSTTPFPGLAALPPCLGAVLVIWATANGSGSLQRFLSFKPFVWIGLLSYSLYLWHWPVMVYSHYWFTGLHSPLLLRVLVVVVSGVLAWLSWRYVELPFRSRTGPFTARPLMFAAAGVSAVIVLVGASISRNQGVPERFPPQVARYAQAYEDRPEMEEADLTTEDAEAGMLPKLVSRPGVETSILLWGDSHARVVSPAIEAVCEELNINGHRASRSATAGLIEWGTPEMRRHNAAVFRWVETHRPTWVVLASRWEKVLQEPEDEAALRATVEALQKTGVKVVIMRQVPSQGQDIPKALARATLRGEGVENVGVTVAEHATATFHSNEVVGRVADAIPDLAVLDPVPYLSREGICIAEESGRALYYDYQHLTTFGASFLQPMFAKLVKSHRLPGRAVSESILDRLTRKELRVLARR